MVEEFMLLQSKFIPHITMLCEIESNDVWL